MQVCTCVCVCVNKRGCGEEGDTVVCVCVYICDVLGGGG